MFEFVNNTYSGIISVLSTLLGLAYPLILGCIEKIDGKYGSTKLTDRFKNESIFKNFKIWLVVNLIIAVLFPFMMYECSFICWLIAIQCICATWMVFYTFRLFALIMQYYDPKELMTFIATDFKRSLEKEDKPNQAIYFTQWSDLTSVLINSADESLVQSVYDEWYNYVLNKKEEYKNIPIVYDDYFYEGITRLNVNLCRCERIPISVNNSNSLLTSLIDGDVYITDKTFNALWRNLIIQIHYGREDLIMEYWKCASQKYELFMKELHVHDIDFETRLPYPEEEIVLRNKQRKEFLEFHIMFCSMLIQEKKYNLIEQMLLYSSSFPPSYPLVPSRMYDILQWLIEFNSKRLNDTFYYEQRYSMPNMHGITGGKIVDAANFYLALLVYRLYSIYWTYGIQNVLGCGILPKSQKELSSFKDILNTLNKWLNTVYEDKNLLGAIHLVNIEDRLKTLKEQWNNDNIPAPLEIVNKLSNDIEIKIDDTIINQPLDEGIVNIEIDKVKGKLAKFIEPYSCFVKMPNCGSKSYSLNSSEKHLYPNSAFQKNPGSSHVNIADCMFQSIWRNFTHYFSTAFYSEHPKVDYAIDSSILFKALDKLLGKCDDYLIVCFGIYLERYLNQVEGFIKTGNRLYKYQKVTILSLDCPGKVFSQRIYIIKKIQLPKLSFKKPPKTSLNEIDGKLELWMKVEKIKVSEKEIPKNLLEELGTEKDKYCIFETYWNPILYFSTDVVMKCLKVNYKSNDEGNWDSLDNIKPL